MKPYVGAQGNADGPCPRCRLHHYNIHVVFGVFEADGGQLWNVTPPFLCECGVLIDQFHYHEPEQLVFTMPMIWEEVER